MLLVGFILAACGAVLLIVAAQVAVIVFCPEDDRPYYNRHPTENHRP